MVRRARLVLVAAMLAVVGFGVLGFGAFGKLKTGGFQNPGADSTTAQTMTDQRFGGSVGVVEEEGDGAGSGRVRRGGLRGSVRVKDGDGLTLAAIKELEVFLAESGDCLILRVADGDGEFDEIGLGGEREGGR